MKINEKLQKNVLFLRFWAISYLFFQKKRYFSRRINGLVFLSVFVLVLLGNRSYRAWG